MIIYEIIKNQSNSSEVWDAISDATMQIKQCVCYIKPCSAPQRKRKKKWDTYPMSAYISMIKKKQSRHIDMKRIKPDPRSMNWNPMKMIFNTKWVNELSGLNWTDLLTQYRIIIKKYSRWNLLIKNSLLKISISMYTIYVDIFHCCKK